MDDGSDGHADPFAASGQRPALTALPGSAASVREAGGGKRWGVAWEAVRQQTLLRAPRSRASACHYCSVRGGRGIRKKGLEREEGGTEGDAGFASYGEGIRKGR